MRVTFLGLGQMGFPMAGHLSRHGHDVVVYNRTAARAVIWQDQYTGRIAETTAQAVVEAEMVCMCLANISATREILLGQGGVLAQMPPGAILIDHGTGTPEFARELYAAAAKSTIGFLDAPVTGGVSAAKAGTLGIMAGGDAEICAAAAPVLQSYAQKISHMGPAGAGHMTKLANVICGIGMGQAVAEAIAFARRGGLDMAQLIEILMSGSSRSYILEQKGPAMASGTHLPANFTVDLAVNNIEQTLQEAARLGAKLPLLTMAGAFYLAIQRDGGGGLDSSSLISQLE